MRYCRERWRLRLAIWRLQVSLQMRVAFREAILVGESHYACQDRWGAAELRFRCCMIATGVWGHLVHRCDLGAACRRSVTTAPGFAVQAVVRSGVWSETAVSGVRWIFSAAQQRKQCSQETKQCGLSCTESRITSSVCACWCRHTRSTSAATSCHPHRCTKRARRASRARGWG